MIFIQGVYLINLNILIPYYLKIPYHSIFKYENIFLLVSMVLIIILKDHSALNQKNTNQ